MDKKLVGLVAVFLLVFSVFMGLLVFNNQFARFIRASQSDASCPNTFVFAQTLNAAINESVAISVFVRDSQDDGVAQTMVSCTTTLGTLNNPQAVSNDLGIAKFTLTSPTLGTATVSCTIPKCGQIANSVTISFN